MVGYQDHDSDDALEWACQEAARRGAPVRVLHAYAREQLYPWGYGYPLPVGDLASVEEQDADARVHPPGGGRRAGADPASRSSR